MQSADKLLEWGSKPTFADFVYTGKGSDWAANVDVIYPLSRTYSGFLEFVRHKASPMRTNLTVSFGHVGEGVDQIYANVLRDNMGDWATEAAERQYERSFARERRS